MGRKQPASLPAQASEERASEKRASAKQPQFFFIGEEDDEDEKNAQAEYEQLLADSVDKAKDVVHVFGAMVQAAALNSAGADHLTALVQESTGAGDEEVVAGAPDACIEMLEGIQDKAVDQLASSRKAVTETEPAFQRLKQSLEDEASVAALMASREALESQAVVIPVLPPHRR